MNSPNRNLAIVKAVREQGEPVTKVAKGPDPRKVDTSGVSYAAWVSVAELSASKV